MQETSETSQAIDVAAAEWLARVDRGPLSDRDAAQLDAWLAGDPRRRGAYARAQVVVLHAERARALGPDFALRRDRRGGTPLTRRRLLTAGGGALAAGVVGGIALNLSLRGTAYATARGEVRRIPLADGSAVTLNTASSIIVSGQGARKVELREGEALFDIASADDGAFVVSVDGVRARTRRAAFLVQKLDGQPIRLLVDAGELELTSTAAPDSLTIGDDSEAEIDRRTGRVDVKPLAPDVLAREQAWRDGKLAFEGQSLAYAAAQFARYGDPLIEIGDPALAQETVVGLFSINDPAGFAQAVAASLDATIRMEGDRIVLSLQA
ncbi:FecR family protein [Brevundimonas diminuta]|uniref:FecR family protein n=1 Tax=Brevundimonas diminuta TaxID=293 RepID=UPI0030F984BA